VLIGLPSLTHCTRGAGCPVGGTQERLAAPPFTTQLSSGSSTKVVFRTRQVKRGYKSTIPFQNIWIRSLQFGEFFYNSYFQLRFSLWHIAVLVPELPCSRTCFYANCQDLMASHFSWSYCTANLAVSSHSRPSVGRSW
jgi:hypothetical protein